MNGSPASILATGGEPRAWCASCDNGDVTAFDLTMNRDRVFASADFFRPTAEGEPIRSVVTESADAVVVAWCVLPGQRIAAHVHPHGQDTWTILSGEGEYQLHADGTSRPVRTGHVVVAPTGSVHGVLNTGNGPLLFISVVSPAEAGYQPL
jgi:quercetin dioxygenase-like cupin family protein